MLFTNEQLTLEHFRQMTELEQIYYEEAFITPTEEAFRWYNKNNLSTVVAFDGTTMAGFMNLFPVHRDILAAIEARTFNDHHLTSDGMLSREETEQCAELHLFLSCVVVAPDYAGRGIARQLYDHYRTLYKAPIVAIWTDNVTEDGARFSERLGFVRQGETAHGSQLYKWSVQHG